MFFIYPYSARCTVEAQRNTSGVDSGVAGLCLERSLVACGRWKGTQDLYTKDPRSEVRPTNYLPKEKPSAFFRHIPSNPK